MKGSIGVRGGTVSARVPLRLGLLDIEYRKNPEPLKRTDIPPAAGAGRPCGTRPAKHTDEVVLEVRRLREFANLTHSKILEEVSSKGVDINLGDVRRYCAYATRATLIPSDTAKPYL